MTIESDHVVDVNKPANLILSRREGQKLIIRPLGVASEFDIVIDFAELTATKARVGIRCLREISIIRGEIEDSFETKLSRLGNAWAHFQNQGLSK